MTIEQTLTLLLVAFTFALALATLYLAVATVKGFREQLQLQTFAEYTGRYNSLLMDLPLARRNPQLR